MLPTNIVTVLRPKVETVDFEETVSWYGEAVGDVIIDPGSTSELNREDEQGGDSTFLTLHFPKSYESSLAGCRVELPEPWLTVGSIVGDPEPYPEGFCPTRWNRKATLEVSGTWRKISASAGSQQGTTSS